MHRKPIPPGVRTSPLISDLARKILWQKYAAKGEVKFDNREISFIQAYLDAHEMPDIIDGVNFSRIQIDEVLRQRRKGAPIEFETLGPYLIDYVDSNGVITLDNLTLEDKIGLEVAIKLKKLLPKARLISLYDDLNVVHANNQDIPPVIFSKEVKENFKNSLLELFKSVGILNLEAEPGKDYLFIAESDKIKSAERMVMRLERTGNIARKDEEIWFINEMAENLLHRKFRLRSRQGHWLCVALDAASFLAEENKRLCHLVVLPDYMKQQQDEVWEVLRVLSLHPLDYHNIFYPIDRDPKQISKTIWKAFQ